MQPGGSGSAEGARTWLKLALEGELPVFEWTHRHSSGELIPCEVRLLRMPSTEQRLVRGSLTNIAERKRVDAERETLIGDLEEINAELERFTYTVSHDLKSPLITIKGFIGYLKKDAEEKNLKALDDDIAEILSATDKMHEMLTELLDLSRIGRLTGRHEVISATEMAQEAATSLAVPAADAGVSIEVTPNIPSIHGDRIRMREVYQNLLENSVKFSPPHSAAKVAASYRVDDGKPVFFVADSGIGIEPCYSDKIFGLFEQLDPNSEGTGIGLAIVKRIIDVHNGEVWVESEGAGKGTRFCFTLPAA